MERAADERELLVPAVLEGKGSIVEPQGEADGGSVNGHVVGERLEPQLHHGCRLPCALKAGEHVAGDRVG